jgi:dihydroorotate dehydrogenase (fumarate)
VNLATRYLGLDLHNPLVAAASPLSQTVDGIRALADAGVGAVVLYSLFEEELRREAEAVEAIAVAQADVYAESLSYLPESALDPIGSRRYLRLLERAAAAVDVPVIASLNGATPGGWVRYARELESAGASAIELNVFYVAGDPRLSGREVEDRHVEIVRQVRAAVELPLAVKLGPYFSSVGEMALRIVDAGADGLVLFNRFLAPDIDPERMEAVSDLELSRPFEARLSLTWIALLRGRVRASLAGSSGVGGVLDVVRYLLAGADIVMSASALLRHGPGYAVAMLDELEQWLDERGFADVDEVRGRLAVPEGADGAAVERAGYVGVLQAAKQPYGPW